MGGGGGKEEKRPKKISETMNKMAIRMHILTINLNVNGLNGPTKRHRLAE